MKIHSLVFFVTTLVLSDSYTTHSVTNQVHTTLFDATLEMIRISVRFSVDEEGVSHFIHQTGTELVTIIDYISTPTTTIQSTKTIFVTPTFDDGFSRKSSFSDQDEIPDEDILDSENTDLRLESNGGLREFDSSVDGNDVTNTINPDISHHIVENHASFERQSPSFNSNPRLIKSVEDDVEESKSTGSSTAKGSWFGSWRWGFGSSNATEKSNNNSMPSRAQVKESIEDGTGSPQENHAILETINDASSSSNIQTPLNIIDDYCCESIESSESLPGVNNFSESWPLRRNENI